MALLDKVQTVWSGVAGTPYYSTMYFADTGSATSAQDAVNAVQTFWSSIAANISNLLSWEVLGDVPIIDDSDGSLDGSWAVTNAIGAGTNAGQLLPRQANGIVRWETGVVVGGRRLRGHTFVPGPTESLNDAPGVPVAGYAGALTINGNLLIGDAGNELRVWSRKNGTSLPATFALGLSYWATQRSRRT